MDSRLTLAFLAEMPFLSGRYLEKEKKLNSLEKRGIKTGRPIN